MRPLLQVGRPRPDWVNRCWPSSEPVFSDAGLPQCEAGVDAHELSKGLRSFPSGEKAAWEAEGGAGSSGHPLMQSGTCFLWPADSADPHAAPVQATPPGAAPDWASSRCGSAASCARLGAAAAAARDRRSSCWACCRLRERWQWGCSAMWPISEQGAEPVLLVYACAVGCVQRTHTSCLPFPKRTLMMAGVCPRRVAAGIT